MHPGGSLDESGPEEGHLVLHLAGVRRLVTAASDAWVCVRRDAAADEYPPERRDAAAGKWVDPGQGGLAPDAPGHLSARLGVELAAAPYKQAADRSAARSFAASVAAE